MRVPIMSWREMLNIQCSCKIIYSISTISLIYSQLAYAGMWRWHLSFSIIRTSFSIQLYPNMEHLRASSNTYTSSARSEHVRPSRWFGKNTFLHTECNTQPVSSTQISQSGQDFMFSSHRGHWLGAGFCQAILHSSSKHLQFEGTTTQPRFLK